MENESVKPVESNEKPAEKPKKSKKKKKSKSKPVLSFLLWTGVAVIVIFLMLFLSSRIGEFESIGAMLAYIRSQF